MPYQWTPSSDENQTQWQLDLWPYRSLLRKDFVLFIGGTIAIIALPLIALIGSVILWVILGFFGVMLWALWGALHISYKRGELLEVFQATPEIVTLTRHNPNGTLQTWEANRYWATAHIHPKDGPVENYLTLRGGDREVEIGAFLDAAERLSLYGEIQRALRHNL
ncbi:MAG: DUF2244 domain-containing protein [Yoonia sp.]|nr:DUF2244 domain-containing protein [Yoonia sp.]